jgi:hypothetical protein
MFFPEKLFIIHLVFRSNSSKNQIIMTLYRNFMLTAVVIALLFSMCKFWYFMDMFFKTRYALEYVSKKNKELVSIDYFVYLFKSPASVISSHLKSCFR